MQELLRFHSRNTRGGRSKLKNRGLKTTDMTHTFIVDGMTCQHCV